MKYVPEDHKMKKPLRNKSKNICVYVNRTSRELADLEITSSENVQERRLFFCRCQRNVTKPTCTKKEIEKRNSTQITGPGHSSSSVSYEMNNLKGNAGSWSCRDLQNRAFTF